MPVQPNKLNPLYFFNNQYNDEIIIDERKKLYNKTLDALYDTQGIAQQMKFISGPMTNFTINAKLNTVYHLPSNTYTYQIKMEDVPMYNLKHYIDTYRFSTPVSLIDIMKDSRLFKTRIMFSIGEYIFLNLKIIYTEYNTLILCIYPNATDGLLLSKIQAFISNNATWALYTKPQSDFYYSAFTNINNLFESNSPSIKVSKFTQKKFFTKPSQTNKYDMFITGDPNNPNLLYQTETVLSTDANSNPVFVVASAFKSLMTPNPNAVNCFVINDYRRIGEYQVTTNSANSHISITLYGETNPILPENILVHLYDNVNNIKKNRYGGMYIIVPHIPDVYELVLPNPGTYIIEYYDSSLTGISFENPLIDFKNFICSKYSKSVYANAMSSRNLPDSVLDTIDIWIASTIHYDYDDYQKSSQYDDVRAYTLQRTIDLLNIDPYQALYYVQRINDYNRPSFTIHNEMNEKKSIYNRTIRDTSNNTNAPSDLNTFDTDMIYIEFSNSTNNNRPILLYIDGKRVEPTLVKTLNNKTSIYIKKSMVTSSSTIDAKILLANSDSEYSTINGSFTPTNVTDYVDFPNADAFKTINPSELLFYNVLTGDYIASSKIDFRISTDNYIINHPVSESNEISFGVDPDSYLITSDDNYFKTSNSESVILAKNETNIDVDITGDTKINKYIDSGKIKIKINDPTLINTEIGITNTNTYKKVYIPNALIGSENRLVFSKYNLPSDPNRITLYANGQLLKYGLDYAIAFSNKYNGDATIIVSPLPGSNGKLELLAESNSITTFLMRQQISLYSEEQGLISVQSGFKGDNQPFLIDIRYADVFLNGYRVPLNRLHEVHASNTFKIDNCADGDTVSIYITGSQDPFREFGYKYGDTINNINSNLLRELEYSIGGYIADDDLYEILPGEFANYLYNLHGSTNKYKYIEGSGGGQL